MVKLCFYSRLGSLGITVKVEAEEGIEPECKDMHRPLISHAYSSGMFNTSAMQPLPELQKYHLHFNLIWKFNLLLLKIKYHTAIACDRKYIYIQSWAIAIGLQRSLFTFFGVAGCCLLCCHLILAKIATHKKKRMRERAGEREKHLKNKKEVFYRLF